MSFVANDAEWQLINASAQGNVERVQELLSSEPLASFPLIGIYENPALSEPTSALLQAITNYKLDVVKLLVASANIDVNAGNPAAEAAKFGFLDIFKILVEQGKCDLSNDDSLAFRIAAQNGNIAILEYILGLDGFGGSDPAALNNQALCYVCQTNQLDVARILVGTGKCDPAARDNENIVMCAGRGYLEMIQWLLTLPNVDVTNNDNEAIQYAASSGQVDVVRFLLTVPGVNIYANDNFALRSVVENRDKEMLNVLLENGDFDFSMVDAELSAAVQELDIADDDDAANDLLGAYGYGEDNEANEEEIVDEEVPVKEEDKDLANTQESRELPHVHEIVEEEIVAEEELVAEKIIIGEVQVDVVRTTTVEDIQETVVVDEPVIDEHIPFESDAVQPVDPEVVEVEELIIVDEEQDDANDETVLHSSNKDISDLKEVDAEAEVVIDDDAADGKNQNEELVEKTVSHVEDQDDVGESVGQDDKLVTDSFYQEGRNEEEIGAEVDLDPTAAENEDQQLVDNGLDDGKLEEVEKEEEEEAVEVSHQELSERVTGYLETEVLVENEHGDSTDEPETAAFERQVDDTTSKNETDRIYVETHEVVPEGGREVDFDASNDGVEVELMAEESYADQEAFDNDGTNVGFGKETVTFDVDGDEDTEELVNYDKSVYFNKYAQIDETVDVVISVMRDEVPKEAPLLSGYDTEIVVGAAYTTKSVVADELIDGEHYQTTVTTTVETFYQEASVDYEPEPDAIEEQVEVEFLEDTLDDVDDELFDSDEFGLKPVDQESFYKSRFETFSRDWNSKFHGSQSVKTQLLDFVATCYFKSIHRNSRTLLLASPSGEREYFETSIPASFSANSKVLVLSGPAGSGKKPVALLLAECLGLEVFSVDLASLKDAYEILGDRGVSSLFAKIAASGGGRLVLLENFDKIDRTGAIAQITLDVLSSQSKQFIDPCLHVSIDLSDTLFVLIKVEGTDNTPLPAPFLRQPHIVTVQTPVPTLLELLDVAQTIIVPRVMESVGISDEKVSWAPGAIKALCLEEWVAGGGYLEVEKRIWQIVESSCVQFVTKSTTSYVIGQPESSTETDEFWDGVGGIGSCVFGGRNGLEAVDVLATGEGSGVVCNLKEAVQVEMGVGVAKRWAKEHKRETGKILVNCTDENADGVLVAATALAFVSELLSVPLPERLVVLCALKLNGKVTVPWKETREGVERILKSIEAGARTIVLANASVNLWNSIPDDFKSFVDVLYIDTFSTLASNIF
ncbi:ATP-dependent Lon protease pim1 [Rhizoclosmatium sp. JEL0117]|nr:ATP-dependent Lon protease pim1 [Rhizoclosmatium sp. JEL0117]